MLLEETAAVRLLGLRIPVMPFVAPHVILASGMNAFALIRARHPRVVPVFKYARMEFLKQADGDVVFRTRHGRRIAEAVATTERTGERVTLPVDVVATVPEKYGDEPAATFTMGLSLKKRT
jgi:hypothetical protein